jgi:hypothetical protein
MLEVGEVWEGSEEYLCKYRGPGGELMQNAEGSQVELRK